MHVIPTLREMPSPIVSQPALPPLLSRGISDSEYLLVVIHHLARTRTALGLSLRDVARLAKVKKSVIDLAEQDCRIPTCREFKAWSAALGLSWEELWSACCPPG